MASRAGVHRPLEMFDAISRQTPRLADLRPTGRFLMEDFYFAGGLRALLAQLAGRVGVPPAGVGHPARTDFRQTGGSKIAHFPQNQKCVAAGRPPYPGRPGCTLPSNAARVSKSTGFAK